MSRSTKWKLAIIAGISESLVYAEAKYCAFEIHGEPKYYECPRTEYCCKFGCCVSPGFQIYHLWYYWLLVIIMFLVCSGGGWWYRYWLQGRYRAAASAIPTRSSSSRTQNSLRGPTCQAQQARITYNTARNTVLLHRMWKGPHRSATSPAYSASGAATSGTHYQNTSVVLNDANCLYYQLYGPPPSYETVIAQTRGKISNPSSPELMRGSTLQPESQMSAPIAPPTTPEGLFFGAAGHEAPHYNQVAAEYARLGHHFKLTHGIPRRERTEFDSACSSHTELMAEPIATTSTSLAFEGCSSSSHRPLSRSEARKIQGGSLKIPRKRDQHSKHQEVQRVSRRLSSTDCEASTSHVASRREDQPCLDYQSIPSSNVISAANATSKYTVVEGPATTARLDAGAAPSNAQQRDHHSRHTQQQRPHAPSISERSSTNYNVESKRKLDRSKSLD